MIQGFSGGLLNRELIYQTDLPSFQRDFASLKTLDHGTGPAITFTRASGATYFDADGVLQTAANDTPRFDHDPATGGSSLGLLIEEGRTNSIRNSQAGGAAAGTLPTNWSSSTGATNGLTRTIVGGGTEDGLTYLEIQFAGTPTASGSLFINAESASQVVAANGQTWTFSAYVKLQAGSATNTTIRLFPSGGLSDGSLVSGQITVTTFTPTTNSIKTQRVAATHTMSDATVVRARGTVEIQYTNSNPIDLTLRIAAPQLEQGAFPTSYIPTTTAAATRSADSAVVTPISSFWNQAEGTMFVEFQAQTLTQDTGSTSRRILQADDGSTAIFITQNGTNDSLQFARTGGDWNFTLGSSITSNTRAILGFAANNVNGAVNGTDGTDDTSAAIPSVTTLRIGRAVTNGRFQGHIRKIAYWPKRLTNTLLEQLTT
jgi:hypothetical protein